jgi:hypothetical protein
MDSRAHVALQEFGGEEWRIMDEEAQVKKYILVMRDPRDATVSLMHYHHDGADDEKLQEGTRQYIKHYTTWLGFWCVRVRICARVCVCVCVEIVWRLGIRCCILTTSYCFIPLRRYWYQTRYVSALYPTMVLVYRDVKEDPVREYGRVLDYLGLKVRLLVRSS